MRRGVSLALNRYLHSARHTGRNMDADDFLVAYHALAVAVGAFVTYHLAFAMTGGADLLHLHHTEDAPLGAYHMSRPFAGGTRFTVLAVRRTRAAAVRAGNLLADLDFLVHASGYLIEREFDFHPQVAAALYTSAAPSASEEGREMTAVAHVEVEARIREQVAETREDVLHAESA